MRSSIRFVLGSKIFLSLKIISPLNLFPAYKSQILLIDSSKVDLPHPDGTISKVIAIFMKWHIYVFKFGAFELAYQKRKTLYLVHNPFLTLNFFLFY